MRGSWWNTMKLAVAYVEVLFCATCFKLSTVVIKQTVVVWGSKQQCSQRKTNVSTQGASELCLISRACATFVTGLLMFFSHQIFFCIKELVFLRWLNHDIVHCLTLFLQRSFCVQPHLWIMANLGPSVMSARLGYRWSLPRSYILMNCTKCVWVCHCCSGVSSLCQMIFNSQHFLFSTSRLDDPRSNATLSTWFFLERWLNTREMWSNNERTITQSRANFKPWSPTCWIHLLVHVGRSFLIESFNSLQFEGTTNVQTGHFKCVGSWSLFSSVLLGP